MWPYLLLFFVPAVAALGGGTSVNSRGHAVTATFHLGWAIVGVSLALMIGLRFEVGGDWSNYFGYLDIVDGQPLWEVLQSPDPGYLLLNWVSLNLGLGIYGVNFACGAMFAIALVAFCRSLPRPWLALAVAVPYLVIVVAMGYTRQGVALAFAMLGLIALRKESVLWFTIWVVIGATFHKTAVILLPIAALASSRNRYLTIVWVAVVAAAAYYLLLAESVNTLYAGYIEEQYESDGAAVRLAMNALPAVILLIWFRRFNFTQAEGSLWRWFAMISLVLSALLVVSPSSTAVDRVALYLIPLQLVVFSHLPSVFSPTNRNAAPWLVSVLVYYLAVELVWLLYATHAHLWLPYRFYPLEIM